jgi:hypothetical protein
MLRSKTSSCTRVACSRCSRLSGRWVEKGGQQSIFTLGQCDLGSVGVGEAPDAPIELPAAELAPATLCIPLRRGASGLLPSQHGAAARQKFPTVPPCIIVGPQFSPTTRSRRRADHRW